jgi:hypothetical protein
VNPSFRAIGLNIARMLGERWRGGFMRGSDTDCNRVQVPVDSFHCLPAGPTLCTAVPKTGTFVGNFGDPFLWNTTFQYHLWEYFWPALEINYEFWPNGAHAGLNQVLLTPELILGRFHMTERQSLIVGAGYQIAVTNNPVTQSNFVASVRFTF